MGFALRLYSLEEILALDTRELALVHAPTCDICGEKILNVHGDDLLILEGNPVHEDCYFKVLGDFIEEHPIGLPKGQT